MKLFRLCNLSVFCTSIVLVTVLEVLGDVRDGLMFEASVDRSGYSDDVPEALPKDHEDPHLVLGFGPDGISHFRTERELREYVTERMETLKSGQPRSSSAAWAVKETTPQREPRTFSFRESMTFAGQVWESLAPWVRTSLVSFLALGALPTLGLTQALPLLMSLQSTRSPQPTLAISVPSRALTEFLLGENVTVTTEERHRSILGDRLARQYSPDLTAGAELIDFVSQVGQLVRRVSDLVYGNGTNNAQNQAAATTPRPTTFTRLTNLLADPPSNTSGSGLLNGPLAGLFNRVFGSSSQTSNFQDTGNESVTLDLPSETTLFDLVAAVIAAFVSPDAGLASPNTAPSTNTRFGLDLFTLPFKKDPLKKVFDLLSLIKLVKIPGASAFADPGSMLFYSLLPSMLPTLMATGLFLYGVYNHDPAIQQEGSYAEGYDYYDSQGFELDEAASRFPAGGRLSNTGGYFSHQPSRPHFNQGNYRDAFKDRLPGGQSASSKYSEPSLEPLGSKHPGSNSARYPPYGYLYRKDQNSDQLRRPLAGQVGGNVGGAPKRPGTSGNSNYRNFVRNDRNPDTNSVEAHQRWNRWQQNQHERREAPRTALSQPSSVDFGRTTAENHLPDGHWNSNSDPSPSSEDDYSGIKKQKNEATQQDSSWWNENPSDETNRWSELLSDGSRANTDPKGDVFQVIDAPQKQEQNYYAGDDSPVVVYSRIAEDESGSNNKQDIAENAASTSYKVSSKLGFHFPHADSAHDDPVAVADNNKPNDSHADQYIENHQPYHGYRRKTTS